MDIIAAHDREIANKQKRGMTSFDRMDTQKLFAALDIKPDFFITDLGCGTGDYSLAFAKKLSSGGMVIAVDKWTETTSALDSKIEEAGLKNIKTITADMADYLPLPDASSDIVFLAMVLHGLNRLPSTDKFFEEVKRVLKKDGRFVVVEFKKEQSPFGPPCEIRLSPKETETLLLSNGFSKGKETDLGHAYMIEFYKNI